MFYIFLLLNITKDTWISIYEIVNLPWLMNNFIYIAKSLILKKINILGMKNM